jgi:hypothetical protein
MISFLTVATVSLFSLVRAGHPSSQSCHKANTTISIGNQVCGDVAAAFPPAVTACGVGAEIASFGVSFFCNRDSATVKNLVSNANLPPVVVRHINGTLTRLNSFVHRLSPYLSAIVKREDPSPKPFQWPGIQKIKTDREFLYYVGQASNGNVNCEIVGRQVCITNSQVFLTCTGAKKWALAQSCGTGTFCKQDPHRADRILCDAKQ